MQCLRILVRLDVSMFSFYELAVCWLDGDGEWGRAIDEATRNCRSWLQFAVGVNSKLVVF
eukprot:scaffold86138_cov66-Cyclotella_meneghiniana.AAC.3